jgi:hypothetical protein
MIKYITIIFMIFLSANANCVDLYDLKKSESRDLNNQSIYSNIYLKVGGMPSTLINLDKAKYYGLWGNGKGLSFYDLDTVTLLMGNWKLPRWPEELKNKNVAEMYQLKSEPEFVQDYSYRPFPSTHAKYKQPPVMGCLSEIPLRYGDVDENKTDELVLLLGHEDQVLDFVMFNPDKEKISFSARVIFSDIDNGYGDDSKYQYTSNFNMGKGDYIGTQTFAKVFIGEFDGVEDSKDIIVWRKQYQPLSTASSTKGFELKSQIYQFYTLKNGEYKLQISLQSQIEQWMSANNLTWQKGFPSKSECAGQEGQLIPEMHDPLLNDPDVLK